MLSFPPLHGARPAQAAVVVDPFHIVRLANMALTTCRQRVQQETMEHRGWKGDPLYDVRKLLLLGAGVAKEKVRDVYLTDDEDLAAARLDDAIAWCSAAEAGPELRRLLKVLCRWGKEILAHHRTGASNGPVEAANLLIKQVKRSGRRFRSFVNYRLRILLAGGHCRCNTGPVTRIRTCRPRWSRWATLGGVPTTFVSVSPLGSHSTHHQTQISLSAVDAVSLTGRLT